MSEKSIAGKLPQEWVARHLRTAGLVAAVVFFIAGKTLWGSVTGSISGVVRDSSGALIPAAEVVALNTQTGVRWTVSTDAQGFYSFQALPVGDYEVDVSKSGFNRYRQTGLTLTVNAALTVDVPLQVGQVTQSVTVNSTVVHVDTTSTQMGEVIGSSKITEVPLLTRGYTDLLALQPGVVPVSSGMAGGQGGEFTATGFGIAPVSGDLNAGNLSVNGMRESANGFLLNGATVQESGFSGTSIIPNLDSIAEFRILTNNFDAEYGAYAGGQINVLTKSGTDRFHGDVFEFVRNTDLEARNFLRYDSWRLPAEPVWRHRGRPYPAQQVVFLCRLPGKSQSPGPELGPGYGSDERGASRRLFRLRQSNDRDGAGSGLGGEPLEPFGLYRDSSRELLHSRMHHFGGVRLSQCANTFGRLHHTVHEHSKVHSPSQQRALLRQLGRGEPASGR